MLLINVHENQIMEQCVARLDVAIFNAILRVSSDEMPSDPISDPISDAEVLPIPAGKASFEAGAQLKIAVSVLVELFQLEFLCIHDCKSTTYLDA